MSEAEFEVSLLNYFDSKELQNQLKLFIEIGAYGIRLTDEFKKQHYNRSSVRFFEG